MGKRKFNVSMDIINVKKHKSNFDDISEDDYNACKSCGVPVFTANCWLVCPFRKYEEAHNDR